ncbi:MAG: GNAT family N-acetyltransferase [Clostridia bacterium]|nr:GNAT family N-acetyltransferase [Clostridia bacterium]
MYYSEMIQAVKILANEWNLGKKECGVTGNICAWIYLFTVLEESEKIVTYKNGRKLVGFSGYSKANSKKHLLKKKFYTIMKKQLYKSKDIKDLDALKVYENNYNYLPKELENYFDGEVSILIVDKDYRGKNIGKKLLLENEVICN